jgi:hypothetical protein
MEWGDMASGPPADEPDDAIATQPQRRRWWLLATALRGLPLDKAIEIAERAEVFLVAGARPGRPSEAPRNAGIEGPAALPTNPEEFDTSPGDTEAMLDSLRKEDLNARLLAGAGNGELAAEFGLTSRQVQGFRMQLARKAARIEATGPVDEALADKSAMSPAPKGLVEDVMRYLRQQGDVVLDSGPLEFVVNGRIRVTFEQLLHRANRLRARQNKPEFVLSGAAVKRGTPPVT